ncbi:tellurite resistance TerB family protein [Microvirga antarctica]|uniref:tellurite resistance TerB family protein n=1 Tax=Microvirga antarctica TaxID=2819233 RepID=UPI001FE2E402|nr:tellurite resistance TerB family protein [Microvirga antarctica]
MVDYRKLLDAVVGSMGRGDVAGTAREAAAGLGKTVDQAVADVKATTPDQFLQKAKELAAQHPGLTQAAVVGLAGLLFKNRKGGLSSGLVKLGGLAVIGALAYKATQSRSTGPTEPSRFSDGPTPVALDPALKALAPTDDDARLLLRAMVAAAAADGQIDDNERTRITKGLVDAGIDPEASRWLEDEMASPADVDELAEPVNDPDLAARVYAAARITIDPDTLQERDFLQRLALALDLDPAVLREIDSAATGLREKAATDAPSHHG